MVRLQKIEVQGSRFNLATLRSAQTFEARLVTLELPTRENFLG